MGYLVHYPKHTHWKQQNNRRAKKRVLKHTKGMNKPVSPSALLPVFVVLRCLSFWYFVMSASRNWNSASEFGCRSHLVFLYHLLGPTRRCFLSAYSVLALVLLGDFSFSRVGWKGHGQKGTEKHAWWPSCVRRCNVIMKFILIIRRLSGREAYKM